MKSSSSVMSLTPLSTSGRELAKVQDVIRVDQGPRLQPQLELLEVIVVLDVMALARAWAGIRGHGPDLWALEAT